MIKGVIFDLDQTIIDSSIAEPYRRKRDWPTVYGLIPSFNVYDGFDEVFNEISDKVKIGIVTSAQGVYASKVVEKFNIPHEFIVDFYSTKMRKPNPAPMLRALELFGLEGDEVISFGDRKMDIIASHGAGIKGYGCSWGTNELDLLKESNPIKIIDSPLDILSVIND